MRLVQSFQNYKKKVRRYKKVKEVKIIEKKDLEELQMKYKDILYVLL
jgi:hypothetical protein